MLLTHRHHLQLHKLRKLGELTCSVHELEAAVSIAATDVAAAVQRVRHERHL